MQCFIFRSLKYLVLWGWQHCFNPFYFNLISDLGDCGVSTLVASRKLYQLYLGKGLLSFSCQFLRSLSRLSAHSRSLPLTPAHYRSLPLTTAHYRSLPLTSTHADAWISTGEGQMLGKAVIIYPLIFAIFLSIFAHTPAHVHTHSDGDLRRARPLMSIHALPCTCPHVLHVRISRAECQKLILLVHHRLPLL